MKTNDADAKGYYLTSFINEPFSRKIHQIKWKKILCLMAEHKHYLKTNLICPTLGFIYFYRKVILVIVSNGQWYDNNRKV
jgi:hypothetical protein